MKKFLLVIAVVLVVVILALVFGRNIIARTVVINGIKQVCGLKVDIVKVDINLPKVSVQGLRIYNPSGFSGEILADIPEVALDIDLAGVFRNKIHLKELKLDVREMNVVLNDQGDMNVNSLAILLPKKGGGTPPEVRIDMLSVKIGKVTYKGSLPGAGANAGEFNLNIDETFHDVTDTSKVAIQVLKKVASRIGFGSLSGLLPEGDIKSTVEGLKGLFNVK